jgi:aconitase B
MGDEGSIYLASPELAAIALKLKRFPSVEDYFNEIG